MGGLRKRLDRLESGGKRCPECGHPDWRFETFLGIEPDEVERAYSEPEHCEACGVRLLYPIAWDGLGAASDQPPVLLVRARPPDRPPSDPDAR